MRNVLIDTDVILDFFFDRKPFSSQAIKIFSLCEQKQLKGFVTSVIISNTYYLLKKTAPHNKVIEKLKLLMLITDILIIDKEVIILALNSKFRDFEYALQNYSAVKSNRIDAIITRNIKDYHKSEIGVFTPNEFIQTLDGK